MPDTERTYGTVVTSAGLALVTAATMRGEKVKLKYLAVGDGGGQYYQPAADASSALNLAASLESRVARVEDGLFNNITGNPFLVSFDALDGVSLVKGVWNAERQRIEC